MLHDDPIITKVLQRQVERPDYKTVILPRHRPKPIKTEPQDSKPNLVDKIVYAWIMLRLVPHLFTILKGLLMKNWKTTVTGVVSAVALIVNSFTGYAIPQEAITAVAIFVIGFFAEDSK